MNDAIRDVLTGIGVAAAVGSFTLIIGMRDNIRKMMQTMYGDDGKNGIKGTVLDHGRKIDDLVLWRKREETVTEIEREFLDDLGRRPERLRDRVQHPDLENTK